jgi:bacterioferritin (cytochrome b1)
MADDDPMDVEGALETLNRALPLQFRSALHYATTAGSVGGLEYIGLAERFWSYAEHELVDARRLVEKILALGGTPSLEVASWPFELDATKAVRGLVECEREVIAALHKVIPTTGQEPRSEALEHLIEHLIIRKQEQADTLLRALGDTE